MNNEKEEELCKKRLLELARSSYYKGFPAYSSFLNLNEQTVFEEIKTKLPLVYYSMWGGFELAERKMICFDVSEIETSNYPLQLIKIEPSHPKFAEKLTHRDYLGSLLGLGIERSVLGDILLQDKTAYVYVEDTMSQYIVDNLEQVKHTNIKCSLTEEDFVFEQNFKEIVGTVQSVRLDSVLSTAFHSSRNQMLPLISNGKVYVNGRQIVSNSYKLKEKDIISVRGMGKFVYEEEQTMTKKGKMKIVIKRYV